MKVGINFVRRYILGKNCSISVGIEVAFLLQGFYAEVTSNKAKRQNKINPQFKLGLELKPTLVGRERSYNCINPASQTPKLCYIFYTIILRVFISSGRGKLCPSVSSFGSGAGQNIQSSCRNDSDCSDSQLCCKTSQRERGCVDPPPKMPESRLKLDG